MRIAVDASCWGNNRGFGRFTRELVGTMSRRDGENEYVLLSDGKISTDDLGSGTSVAEVRTARQVIDSATADGNRGVFDILAFRRAARETDADILFYPAVYSWFPPPRGMANVVTFHDAIAEHFPEMVFPNWRPRLAWNTKTLLARKLADRVLTVSQSAKAEIERYLRIPGTQIDVICEGAANVFAPVADSQRLLAARRSVGLGSDARFLIYVGGFAPHKNLVRLLDAFETVLARPESGDLFLVMSGDPKGGGFHSIYEQLCEKMKSSERLSAQVRLPGYVPDTDLAALYSQTIGLVLPSLSEGFGLPALEAMSCGAPVLASAGGAVMEVAGSAGLDFDPVSEASIARAIWRIACDTELRSSLSENAIPETTRNTWELAADLTIAALERSVANSTGRRSKPA